MSLALCVIYFAVLLSLSAYGLHRLHLVLLCKRHEKRLKEFVETAPYASGDDLLPAVTIDLAKKEKSVFEEMKKAYLEDSKKIPEVCPKNTEKLKGKSKGKPC